MGNRKAGYTRDEAGDRVIGQQMGGGFGDDPIPRARVRHPDEAAREQLAEEARQMFRGIPALTPDVLQRIDAIRANALTR